MQFKLLVAFGLLFCIGLCLIVSTIALVVLPDEWLALVLPIPSAQITLDDSPTDTMMSEPDTVITPEATAAPSSVPVTPTGDARLSASQPTATNPTATARAIPTRTPPKPVPTMTSAPANLVSEVLAPLIQEARRRRAERERREPQAYARRVDKQLNQNRINFLVFGYGSTYEPPLPVQYKGSIAIYSLDLRTLQISTVTLNHDIRAPEIERFIRSTGREPQPTKIHFAYPTGGFDLMRLSAEDATGLAVDFQLAFQDAVVKRIVDDVFGGLSVDVPFTFEAEAIYFQNVKYAAKQYARGRQRMNGMQVLQFIKAIQFRTFA